MSYDRKIDQICPHEVVGEPLYFSPDRQTIRPLRPISSFQSVKVRLNGVVEVPSQGIHLPALAKGSKKGPFTITGGSNDIINIKVNQGSDQVLTATPGRQITANALAFDLNRQLSGANFSVVNGSLQLRSDRPGPQASVFVGSTGTLANTLGFTQNRLWRGITAEAGWSLVNVPTTLSDRPHRLIVMDAPVQGFGSYVEIDYNTVRQECRRCGGVGVENDWRYSKRGDTGEVRDEALLIQEALKFTYTVKGSNRFHAWYGTSILNVIGQKMSNGGLIQNIVSSELTEGFRRWQNIKQQQEQAVGQEVSDKEYPSAITALNVEQSTEDPTVIYINATIVNRSRQPIQIERGVRVPEPMDLLGATAQQGVIRQSLYGASRIG